MSPRALALFSSVLPSHPTGLVIGTTAATTCGAAMLVGCLHQVAQRAVVEQLDHCAIDISLATDEAPGTEQPLAQV
jgi:hypothetical protein